MSSPGLPAGRNRKLAFLLAGFSAVGPFCIDAYLPSLEEIRQVFGISLVSAQQTLTAYMVPFALMTLWHGAISDALGRRRVMLVAMALFALASLGCALSNSIEMLLAFRGLQGVTAGAGMVVGRAVVRDLCDGAEAQRMMSLVSLVFAIAPAVAPVLGGWLHHWFGWRAAFFFMTAFAATVLGFCWAMLPESLPVEKRQPLRPGFLLRSYARVLTNPPFLAACGALALGGSGFFLYILSAPVFLIQHLNIPETQFIWLFGPLTAGLALGSWLSGRLAGRLAPMKTVVLGLGLMGAAALVNLLICLLAPAGVWNVSPLFLYSLGMSLTVPSLTLMALDLFPNQRGLAASCQSFLQSGLNALNAAVVAPVFWVSTTSLAAGQGLFFLLAVGSLAGFVLVTARPVVVAPATGEELPASRT
ncbi:MAG TPA: Bcr/CflA family drug resistance efflux transporter [Myxococcales bacterium]|nr:Bcr/CflA family drug resistance efflux transporter [Myxococcales bacterium]